jgi:hypothetical protein
MLGATIVGCTVQPAPIVIHEDKRDTVWLKFDPASGAGHSHPYEITPEQMTRVLSGVHVQKRDVVGGFGLYFGDKEGAPAFSATQITLVAPLLATALRKASPKDMATFYLTTYDKDQGRLVTSGGLFVREGRMFVIVANAHTSPISVQYENTYELDTHDEPLLPIARKKFLVGFKPKHAWVPNGELRGKAGYERYEDESKLVIIDLSKLFAQPGPPAPSASAPTPPSP